MIDIDDYINKLHTEIEHLKSINESLRKEIRTQRAEIAQYRNTINILLDNDNPPMYQAKPV